MLCGPETEFMLDLACQITNNVAVIIGGVLAIVISAFFYRKQNKIQNTLSEISSTYIIRTALINLKVIYSGGDQRALATNDRKNKYAELLKNNKTKFIQQNPESKELINKIYDYAQNSDLDLSVDHTNFVNYIEKILSNYPNPFHIAEDSR